MTVFSGFYILKKKAYKNTVNGFIPSSLTIPALQDKLNDCRIIVKPGDKVSEGQLLASSGGLRSGRSMIYSPLPGTVEDIVQCTCPDGRLSSAVKLKFGGKFSFTGKKIKAKDFSAFSPNMLVSEIDEKGIINTFIADRPVPLAFELKKNSERKNKLLIVRLFDEDPSRLTDSLISSFFFKEVCAGADLCARALDAEKIVFIKSKDFAAKTEDFNFSRKAYFFSVDSKYYPAGFKKEICRAVKKLSGADDQLQDINYGDLFTDSSTMYDVYRTLCFGMPLTDRYVHISGECLHASGMIKVQTGITLQELAEQCGGFVKEPSAIIINGIVSGVSAQALDIPVTKYVKSVSFLPAKRTPRQLKSMCIRCGNCRRECPRALSPDVLYRHIKGSIIADKSYIDSAKLCSLCGLCNAVCPARLPISQTIESFNKKIEASNNESFQ